MSNLLSLSSLLVNHHDLIQEVEGLAVGPLEGVPSHDGAEGTAVGEVLNFLKDRISALGGPAAEDDDALSVETGLLHVRDPLGQGADVHLGVDALACVLLHMGGGRLHLHDVCTQLAGDLGRICNHVDGGLARGANLAAWVRPNDRGQPHLAGLANKVSEVLELLVPQLGGWVDGVSDRTAAQAEGVFNVGGEGGARVGAPQRVRIVDLEDHGELPSELPGTLFELTEGSSIGVASRVHGKLRVVAGVIAGGVRLEGAVGAVFEALVHWEDDHLPRPRKLPMHQHPTEVTNHSRVFALVVIQDLFHSGGATRQAGHGEVIGGVFLVPFSTN
eukprot:503108_1